VAVAMLLVDAATVRGYILKQNIENMTHQLYNIQNVIMLIGKEKKIGKNPLICFWLEICVGLVLYCLESLLFFSV